MTTLGQLWIIISYMIAPDASSGQIHTLTFTNQPNAHHAISSDTMTLFF